MAIGDSETKIYEGYEAHVWQRVDSYGFDCCHVTIKAIETPFVEKFKVNCKLADGFAHAEAKIASYQKADRQIRGAA